MSIKKLQEKIGVNPDGEWGPTTLKAATAFFKFTPARSAHFFGQTAHETGGFSKFAENLNYSAEGLHKTFKKYFPTLESAKPYSRNPEKIANRVYANRMGNGNEASGDGWKYRGRGALQLTGKGNYEAFAKHVKNPSIMTNPDQVATDYAFQSAMFFFDNNKLWAICDKGVNDAAILELTKRINGGTIGLDHREQLTRKYFADLQ